MAGFECRERCRAESDPREEAGLGADADDHEIALAPDLHSRTGRPDTTRRTERATFITPSDQPGGFAGGINATHLRRDRSHTRNGQGEHGGQ